MFPVMHQPQGKVEEVVVEFMSGKSPEETVAAASVYPELSKSVAQGGEVHDQQGERLKEDVHARGPVQTHAHDGDEHDEKVRAKEAKSSSVGEEIMSSPGELLAAKEFWAITAKF